MDLTTGATGSIAPCKLRGSRDVTAVIDDTDMLRDLDHGTRQAWRAYSERLRGLTGEEYESAESESWGELQRELRRLERRRQTLAGNST